MTMPNPYIESARAPHRLGHSLGVIAAGILLVGCKRDVPAPPPQQPATVEKVKDAPAVYFAKEVTLVGEVDQVRGPRVFQLERWSASPTPRRWPIAT